MYKPIIKPAVGGLAIAFALVFVAVPAGAIGTSSIDNGAITTAKLASNAVVSSKIATGAVGSSEIADGAVRAADIANNAVGSGQIAAGAVGGSELGHKVELATTRDTSATGSFQNLAGDLTYEGGAGGTSSFHAGVMGHFHGSALSNTATGYHAGVIGAYSVATSDGLTGPKAGVVGTVGVDGDASGAADAAVMAVLDGGDPGAVITANAAYGVQYLNATASAKFNYGLDLRHAAVSPYPAVSYAVADIRLANGTTISSGSSNPGTCVKGSLSMNTTDGKLYVCSATNTWTVVGTQS